MGRLITLPFAALLRLIYSLSGSYGLSIIFFSLVVTLIMMPFQMKSKRSMVRMGKLSNRQMELQKQYANNQQKYQEELAKLYQEENINPMGGCLWSLLPMFVIVPLYSVIRQPITVFMGLGEEVCNALRTAAEGLGYVAQTLGNGSYGAYEQIYLSDFITRHWSELDWRGIEGAGDRLLQMHFDFLGINMGAQPSTVFGSFSWEWAVIGLILIPVLAAVSSYVQTIVISKSNGQSQEQQASMRMVNLMMPHEPLVLLLHARRPGPLLDRQQRVGHDPGVHPGPVLHQEDQRRGGGARRQAGGRAAAAHRGIQKAGGRTARAGGRPPQKEAQDPAQDRREARPHHRGRSDRRTALRPGPQLSGGPLRK